MRMAVRRMKFRLIFYASDGQFAANSEVYTLLMSSAYRPQLTLEMLVSGFPQTSDTAVFVMWILIITEFLLKMD
jgi:hypothetical protein